MNYVDTPDGFDGGVEEDDASSVESFEGLADAGIITYPLISFVGSDAFFLFFLFVSFFDPHKAARQLMKLLEEDESKRLRDPALENLSKFSKIRGR